MLQPDSRRVRVPLFLNLDGLGDVAFRLEQFRVRVFHHLDNVPGHLVEERFIQAQRLAVVEGAAHDEPQHVAAALV